jgi:hypothetical protein
MLLYLDEEVDSERERPHCGARAAAYRVMADALEADMLNPAKLQIHKPWKRAAHSEKVSLRS